MAKEEESPATSSTLSGVLHISCIPAELLRIIFIFTARASGDNGRGPPPCTNISHVCKRWRDLALTSQELWATVPRRSVTWTSICLSRAPLAQLDVVIGNDHLHDDEYRDAAMDALSRWPRIRSLRTAMARYFGTGGSLVEKSKLMFDVLLETLQGANPNLEELHLNFTIDSGTLGPWTPIALTSDIFNGQHPPQLCSVELGNCGLLGSPSSRILGSNLHNLRLFNSRAWVDVDSMVEFMRTLPLLEKLVYRFSRSPAQGFDCEPSRKHQPRCIPLPYLQALSLGGFWVQNVTIFIYIAAPPQCHLEILHCEWDYFVDEMPENTALDLIVVGAEALKQHFMPATCQGVAFSSVIPFEFAVWAESDPADPAEATFLPPKLELAVPQTERLSIKRAVFDTIVSQPVVTGTKTLFFTAELWDLYPECFDKYTKVREITLNGYENAEACVSALRTRGADMFPVLSRIVLRRFYVEDMGLELLHELIEVLRTSRAGTRDFEAIVLDDCHYVTDGIVNELRGRFGAERIEWQKHIDWDEGQSP